VFKNKDWYDGEWDVKRDPKQPVPNGLGSYYNHKTGDVITGRFVYGYLEGQGSLVNKEKRVKYEGGFAHSEF
jgi:hypothetical protein